MAIQTSPLFTGFRGSVNKKIVFRQCGGKTVMSPFPNRSRVVYRFDKSILRRSLRWNIPVKLYKFAGEPEIDVLKVPPRIRTKPVPKRTLVRGKPLDLVVHETL